MENTQKSQPAFKPIDCALSTELQQHTWNETARLEQLEREFAFMLLMALMWRESGYQTDIVNTYSGCVGLCQIHPINRVWLLEKGLDIDNPEDNISAAVTILKLFLDKGYTLRESLASYAVGESNMKKGKGFISADKLIDNANAMLISGESQVD